MKRLLTTWVILTGLIGGAECGFMTLIKVHSVEELV
jgi:hypothetical protein